MTSVMMIKIILISLPGRADGKSTKTCIDPSALDEAITAHQRTIETKQRRDDERRGR